MDVYDLKDETIGNRKIRVIIYEELIGKNSKPVTLSTNFKHLDFECDPSVAEDLSQTLAQFIGLSESALKRNYKRNKTETTKWSRRKYDQNQSYQSKKKSFSWNYNYLDCNFYLYLIFFFLLIKDF